ncbi:MAG TPA: hypothetical protein VNX67_06365 [Solirubrobacteraceae bacterium]|jgi:hypothetical protein|nr:hypothetical protein [Solirubrobacteraceae bacterium]
MATRAIVTSHPVVACDVCGRHLLRGESPDVFLAGGQRRTVCELCVPRASAEGWLREADNHTLGVRTTRARRAGSLLGRLRQLREPSGRPLRREAQPAADLASAEEELSEDGLYDFLEGGSIARSDTYAQGQYAGSAEAATDGPGKPAAGRWRGGRSGDGEDLALGEREFAGSGPTQGESSPPTNGDLKMARALEVFNAGEQPRRIAGVARSLGSPAVSVRPLEQSGSTVAIVIAWELCWYRYEVDLGDEAAGAQLVGQGMELEELPDEDRLANAGADERGELTPLALSPGY